MALRIDGQVVMMQLFVSLNPARFCSTYNRIHKMKYPPHKDLNAGARYIRRMGYPVRVALKMIWIENLRMSRL